MKVGAVEDAESFADIAEADAFDVDLGHFFFGDADAVVFDFDVQAAVAIGGAELDFAAVEFWSEAVFQTVFDDGLEKHAVTRPRSKTRQRQNPAPHHQSRR